MEIDIQMNLIRGIIKLSMQDIPRVLDVHTEKSGII